MRRINAMMKYVPHMDLPTIPEVLSNLYDNNFFASIDGQSYFYQFALSPQVGEFFCANVSGTKGPFTTVKMLRLPMGWSWAPAIAQKTSNTLLDNGRLGVAWIDNFVFAGKTEDEVQQKIEEFMTRARHVNLKVDDESPPIMQVGEILGMEVDLDNKRHRMSQKWEQKVRSVVVNTWMTPMNVYRVVGNGVWHGYVTGTPMCHHQHSVDLIRRVASLVAQGLDWDTPLRLDRSETEDLQRWVQDMGANAWSHHRNDAPASLLWTDASDDWWAYLETTMAHEMCGPGAQGTFSEKGWHIFVKEAYAAHLAVSATRGRRRELQIDNKPLVFAIQKKLSSNKIVNTWMSTWDWENIWVRWVPTTEQLADPFTRGERL
eukprot:PhM_4_TR2434/c0_g3_i6/m.78680